MISSRVTPLLKAARRCRRRAARPRAGPDPDVALEEAELRRNAVGDRRVRVGVEPLPVLAIADLHDGRRQQFDSDKLLRGLLKACEKRPVPVSKLEELVEEIESKLQDKPEKEMNAAEIGQYIMRKLRSLDKVAYVRFASVYREFKDVVEFKEVLEKLLKEK